VRFDGDVVVVTGIGRRGQTGEAIARAFGERGARIAAVARGRDEAEERVADLAAEGFEARAFVADLADEAQVGALAAEVRSVYGPAVRAVVQVAGGFAMSGPVADSDFAVWRRQIDINLTTAYLVTRSFLPMLRQARGAIVYFASAAALPGARVAEIAAYAAAKSGVIALLRAVAAEEHASGVRANAIAPTAIRTADNEASMSAGTEYVEREEVANAVLWLCSNEAGGVTGQVIRLA
jgi:3-oxoacyl-[acyl-carrier protein] reductase